ncbi:MAG TPA: DUF5658 family protein [Candidatus Sulfopaludibacter sp.]|jgi:hypothetical protein|nr:DUF5658 family protein [Candidatus Sulfopaludibacter sp.]
MLSLLVFLALQVCDLVTTLVFLHHGVMEANPLVRTLLRVIAQPALAVLLVKLAGSGLAVYAWKSRRTRLLRGANLFFAACVGWNLLAILAA